MKWAGSMKLYTSFRRLQDGHIVKPCDEGGLWIWLGSINPLIKQKWLNHRSVTIANHLHNIIGPRYPITGPIMNGFYRHCFGLWMNWMKTTCTMLVDINNNEQWRKKSKRISFLGDGFISSFPSRWYFSLLYTIR